MSDKPSHEPDEEELERRLRDLIGETEGFLGKDRYSDDELELKLKEFDNQLASAKEDAKEKNQHFDADFDARFSALEERANKAKSLRQAKQHEKNRELGRDRESALGLGMGMTIAYTILGFPMLGAGIGYLLNRSQGSTGYIGPLTTLGAVVGLCSALFMMNRNQKK